jgi:hypothetical protein
MLPPLVRVLCDHRLEWLDVLLDVLRDMIAGLLKALLKPDQLLLQGSKWVLMQRSCLFVSHCRGASRWATRPGSTGAWSQHGHFPVQTLPLPWHPLDHLVMTTRA